MRRYRPCAETALSHAGLFLAAGLLDWATAMAIRTTAERDTLAVVYAVLLTGLWWVTVRAAVRKPSYLLPLMAAAAVGTWVGIRWL